MTRASKRKPRASKKKPGCNLCGPIPGVLFPVNDPSAAQVQRCDECGIFGDDHAAGLALERAFASYSIDAVCVVNEESGLVSLVPGDVDEKTYIEQSPKSAEHWVMRTVRLFQERARRRELAMLRGRSDLLLFTTSDDLARAKVSAQNRGLHVRTGTRTVSFGGLSKTIYCLRTTQPQS